MTMIKPAWLLTQRALIQFPRIPSVLAFSMMPPLIQFLLFGSIFSNLTNLPDFPTDNYYEYLAPAVILFTTVIGIANAGVSFVTDFQNRYFLKLLAAPINMWSILLGRLLSDGFRVYLQAGVIFLIALLFNARVATGIPGALLILLISTLFSIATVGVIVTIVALKTKKSEAVQAVFPLFFILMFLSTGFMPANNISSDVVKTIIKGNPAEYVVRAMHDLMLVGYVAESLIMAFAVILGFALVGIVLIRLSFRSVYK